MGVPHLFEPSACFSTLRTLVVKLTLLVDDRLLLKNSVGYLLSQDLLKFIFKQINTA